jgi:hypothetical protein
MRRRTTVAPDERLRRAIERAGEPGDPSGVYEDLIRRRERRRVARAVQASALAVVVVLGSVSALYALSRLFNGGQSASIGGPPVAGGRITYVRYEGNDPGDRTSILTVELDGSNSRELVHDAGIVTDLDWSSDGTRLVYGRDELFVFDPSTGQSTRIAGPDAYGPSWSPDGSQIAFATDTRGSDAIMVVNADGTDAKVVIEPGDDLGSTDWSPDGSKILFVGPGPKGADDGWDIYVTNADGSDMTKLTNTPDVDLDPTWSPDGSTILFRSGSLELSGSGDLYTMAPDGSDVRRLTNDEFLEQSPAWSPDGSRIAFTGMDHEDTDIYAILADGTGRTRVLETDALAVAWQPVPDGTKTSPTPVETPTPPSPTQGVSEDIGLGFPVCNVSSIKGRFASPDANATSFVATKAGDLGVCPQPEGAFNVVALDTDQDGVADTSYGPIECTLECRTFSAPDVDGDGTDELLVVEGGGAVPLLGLYDFIPTEGALAISPVIVAEPGDPQSFLFEPGEHARFLIGGDGFGLDALQCGDIPAPDGPGIIATSAESLPHDSPDAEWHAHQTTLVLRSDGLLHVVDVHDFTEPVTDDPAGPSFRSGETLCGSNLGPLVPIP